MCLSGGFGSSLSAMSKASEAAWGLFVIGAVAGRTLRPWVEVASCFAREVKAQRRAEEAEGLYRRELKLVLVCTYRMVPGLQSERAMMAWHLAVREDILLSSLTKSSMATAVQEARFPLQLLFLE